LVGDGETLISSNGNFESWGSLDLGIRLLEMLIFDTTGSVLKDNPGDLGFPQGCARFYKEKPDVVNSFREEQKCLIISFRGNSVVLGPNSRQAS